MSARVQPFSNGSDYRFWLAHNCDRCALDVSCPLRNALRAGYWSDGTIPEALAMQFGAEVDEGSAHLPTPCPQFKAAP